MNIKKNSLMVKTFTYLITFSITILICLWLFQVEFLKLFYEQYQIKDIKNVASDIIKSNSISKLEKLAYENDICIELKIDDEIIDYNTLNRDCILKSKNSRVQKLKESLYSNNKTKIEILRSPLTNTKNLIYGISYSDNTYIILNTPLEDVNSTTYILRGQLIYITLITIILAIIVSYFVSKMLNKPILDITDRAKKMAKGEYEQNNKTYDIKEIDDLNNVLNYACSEIKNTDTLRKDLMANVSHDLKTPLTMIKAYAEMARDINNNNEEKRKDNLNVIIDESDRLNILVNDILDLSKIESNKDTLDTQEYDLVTEIKEIVKRYEIIKETENYKFVLNIPNVAIVKADKKRINQVLYNLINNAINYTGEDLTVKINVLELKNRYKVEIIDSGKGISKKDLKLIWTKYYKSDKNHRRNVVGTGLGLSIVKNILENHNFEYGVDSKINKGTKFYFYINKK